VTRAVIGAGIIRDGTPGTAASVADASGSDGAVADASGSGGLSPCHLVLVIWVLFGVAIGIRTILRPASHTVFPVFAASAEHWWADQSLYEAYPGLDQFRYPPVFAIAVTPLARLGLCGGGILWSWLGLAVYGWGVWRFGRAILSGPWTRTRWAVFLALALLGAARGAWNAQSNLLVVGLALLGAAELVCQRWWAAAFLLAGSVAAKLTPLPLALLLCALWPGKLSGRFLLALLPFALCPFLTRPPEIVLEQYVSLGHHLTESSNLRWPGFRDAWTLWAVARQQWTGTLETFSVSAPLDGAWYRWVQMGAGLVTFLWCALLRWRGAQRADLAKWTVGLGCAWLMLFGPAVEHASYAFLAPCLAGAFVERNIWPRGRWLVILSALLVFFLGFGALTRPLLPYTPWPLVILPLGTTLYTIWLLGQSIACLAPAGCPSLAHASGSDGRSLADESFRLGPGRGHRRDDPHALRPRAHGVPPSLPQALPSGTGKGLHPR
jgi:hypothetical protein